MVAADARGRNVMAKKNVSKKGAPKKSDSQRRDYIRKKSASAEFGPNELRIKFDHPHQVLPKLLELAHGLSEAHLDLLSQSVAAQDVLGAVEAMQIVSGCAQSDAWTATLSELGLEPLIFRNCVADGVDNAGYVPPDNIPASPDTRLIDVVAAIQGAPHK
jgi:hypothetical protein